ncbi:PilZ domain-containing protein [Methylobacter psychrophilus]|uniref:PilZ domain-containing protein n=1 Tax=Methylobacter psychrophilus TaxID=96941 RepID=UPI0021D50BDD|nr:PilZ domain-containing protein [Methylobacter psychrophilus]
MYEKLDRARRANLVSYGFIYMGGEEHKITIRNLSISGVLAQLNTDRKDIDIKYVFNHLLISTLIDLYLPEMRLIGEAEVVRADMEEGHILLALEFKNIAFDVDKELNKRKAYRKNIPGPGRILLNGEYHHFATINVSVGGLMICLSETITVEEGTITQFELKHLELEGKVKIIWINHISDDKTLIGLQYVDMKKHALKGIPSFALQEKP